LDEIHRSLAEEWDSGSSPVIRGNQAELASGPCLAAGASGLVSMMYSDCMTYLPDDILCKVDRASMAVGLETRVPFLDHKVAEVAASIPLSMKVRDGRGKLILRKLLHKYVPAPLVDRPKNGFAVPVGEWIKGPFRPWAEELLAPQRIQTDGWFEPNLVLSRWRAHLSGKSDSTAALWAVLMFQSWLLEEQQPLRAEILTPHSWQCALEL
jgi:asparagine synthase (glutamine-hydrolysing)